jgi:hypothetical protein
MPSDRGLGNVPSQSLESAQRRYRVVAISGVRVGTMRPVRFTRVTQDSENFGFSLAISPAY